MFRGTARSPMSRVASVACGSVPIRQNPIRRNANPNLTLNPNPNA